MTGVDNPDALAFARFAPTKMATGAHKTSERFREMARMEDDQAHARKNALLHTGGHGIVNVVMRRVTPPC